MAGQLEQSGTEQKQTTQQERMVKQFGQSLATKILMILIRLGRNAILARVLGPADRGLFSLISSIPELIMVAGNAGLANSAAYHTAKKTRPLHTIVANVNVQILLISTLLFLLSFWVVEQHWLNKDYEEAVVHFRWFIAFAIPLMLFKIVNFNLLHVLQRIGTINLFSLLESTLPLILFLILWWGFDIDALEAAVWSWFLGLAIISVSATSSLGCKFPIQIDRGLQKDLVGFGSRGYLDTMFQALLLRIDFVIISALIDNEALGYYAIATAAAELLLTIPNSLVAPLFSFMLKKNANDKDTVTPIVLRLLLATMVIGAIFFTLFGKALIFVLFGSAFLPAYEPLVVLLPGVIFFSYYMVVRLDLLGNDMPGTVSIISGIAVVVNVTLNFILIPQFGVVGAAAASSIAYFLATLGVYRIHAKLHGFSPFQTLVVRRSDIALVINYIKEKRA